VVFPALHGEPVLGILRGPRNNGRSNPLPEEFCDMNRISTCILFAALGGWMAVGGVLSRAEAKDLRIENAVFSGNEKTPSSESTTIFHNGNVYDFMKDPAETVV
jgi:hypothetical protein